jgi:hypothetical protein
LSSLSADIGGLGITVASLLGSGDRRDANDNTSL